MSTGVTANVMNQQALADTFRARRNAAQPTVTTPTAFPSYGPSLYLTAELTGEGGQPQVEVSFQKTRGDK
jgi:hypothetical protein